MITTTAELNEFYRKYWDGQKILMERRMAQGAVLEVAIEDLDAQCKRGVPVKFQKSFELALADAERSKQRFGLALKGGRAATIDSLQKLILEIVRLDLDISRAQLLEKLMDFQGEGVIDEIADGKIYFRGADTKKAGGTKNAKEKVISYTVKISGLKHRLTRARKEILKETQSR
jgi:hypothetical protein